MLYKYLPYERVDVLQNLKIRFSPLKSLNDPFENLPLIDLKEEREQLHFELISGIDEFWSKAKQEDQTESNKLLLEKVKKELIENIKEKTEFNSVGKRLIDLLGDNFGVLSLSRTEKSLLMWSHYADEGHGFVIGFDDKHSFFKQRDMKGEITKPIPVTYSSKRRTIISNEDKYYQKLLCEKPLEWSYEEEERLFRTFLTKQNPMGKDRYNQDIVLSGFPKEAIKEVILGYGMPESNKEVILKAILTNEITCNVKSSSMSDEEYKLVFKG